MGQSYYSVTKKMEHHLPYRFTCEHCDASSGERSMSFREIGYIRAQSSEFSEQEEQRAYQQGFEKVQRELRAAKEQVSKGIYPEGFDGRCPNCGITQSWMRGRFRKKLNIATAVGAGLGFYFGFQIGFLIMYEISIVLGAAAIAGIAVLCALLGRGIFSIRMSLAIGKTKRTREKSEPLITWPDFM